MDIIKTLDGLIQDVNNNNIDTLDELQREIIYLKSELEAINYTHCCKSDSEQLSCNCPICGNEMNNEIVKHHHCKKCNEHYTTT